MVELNEFSSRHCCLPVTDPSFSEPTGQDLDDLMNLMEWTQREIAYLCGLNYIEGKGCSTLRGWKQRNSVPYPVWHFLLVSAGIINIRDSVTSMEQKIKMEGILRNDKFGKRR